MAVNEDRIYLRIEEELKQEMNRYCKRHRVSMSTLVRRFFLKLLEKERKQHEDEARQF